MAGGRSPDGDNRRVRDADEARLAGRLRQLGERLDAISPAAGKRRGNHAPEPREGEGPSNVARAMRLSSEFIGGIVVGAIIGWLVDWAAGTSPWGMIVFVLLGFAAGTLNVVRSAGLVAPPGAEGGQDQDRNRTD